MSQSGMIIELWFDNEAEEAAKFYCSVFKDSSLGAIRHYTAETPSNKPVGSVLTVDFTLNGQRFQALNGGSAFKFNEAVSIIIECQDQAEMDYYYDALSAVPESEVCGWLKDKYGVSWQVVTHDLDELLYGGDEESNKRAMEALLKMSRLDIAALKAASAPTSSD